MRMAKLLAFLERVEHNLIAGRDGGAYCEQSIVRNCRYVRQWRLAEDAGMNDDLGIYLPGARGPVRMVAVDTDRLAQAMDVVRENGGAYRTARDIQAALETDFRGALRAVDARRHAAVYHYRAYERDCHAHAS